MNIRLKYFIVGALFGMCFPLGAGIFELQRLELSLSLLAIKQIHQQNFILYMIDSAPLFLGLFALIGGVSKDKSLKLIAQLSSSAEQLSQNTGVLKYQAEETLMQYTHSIEKLIRDYSNINKLNRSTFGEVSNTLTGTTSIMDEIKAVQIALSRLTEFNSAVEANNQRVKKYLNTYLENVRRLHDYFDYLDDFSRQIELLAINSAIEANKHGSEGKAFLVFAHNIHDMALETKKRNEVVLKVIEEISVDTSGLSMVSEDERENISAIIDQAKSVDESANKCSANIELFIDSLRIASSHLDKQNGLATGFSSTLHEIQESNAEIMDQLEHVIRKQITIMEEMSSLDTQSVS